MDMIDYGMYINEAWLSVRMSFEVRASVRIHMSMRRGDQYVCH